VVPSVVVVTDARVRPCHRNGQNGFFVGRACEKFLISRVQGTLLGTLPVPYGPYRAASADGVWWRINSWEPLGSRAVGVPLNL
jgi:hypothetical protein